MKEQNFRQEIIDALRATAPEGVSILPPSEGNGYKDHTEVLNQILVKLDSVNQKLYVSNALEQQIVYLLDRIDKNIDDWVGSQ